MAIVNRNAMEVAADLLLRVLYAMGYAVRIRFQEVARLLCLPVLACRYVGKRPVCPPGFPSLSFPSTMHLMSYP
jgi:hypothetical protein